MDVLLINPWVSSWVSARISAAPLGLAYVSAALKREGIESGVLDAEGLGLSLEQTVARAKESKARIMGLTAMTPSAEAAYELAEKIRPFAEFLVMGGPHVSALGSRVFSECPVELDALVCGEAEETFPSAASLLLSRGLSGLQENRIPGLLLPGDKEQGKRDWPRVADLDALPFPDRDSLPLHLYRHPLFGNQPVATMLTSRGCPYRCIFCDKAVCGSAWRGRSPENVVAEMEELVKGRGLRRVIIYDDLFTMSRDRVMEICERILTRGLEFRWKCEGRVNKVDSRMLGLMKKAGCEIISYGVETATEHGLAFLQKDITVDQVREAFAMTKRAGIKTLGYFVLGIPGETLEDEMKTVQLAIELDCDYAQFEVLMPLPGTRLYELAEQRKWLAETAPFGPADRGRRGLALFDGYWNRERLEKMVRIAHRRFYFRPRYLFRRIKDAGGLPGLIHGFSQAFRLARWTLRH